MGSSGKTRTTFAKLSRESKLRDKRAEKEARKAARKLGAVDAAGDMAGAPDDLRAASTDADLHGSHLREEATGSGLPDFRDGGM